MVLAHRAAMIHAGSPPERHNGRRMPSLAPIEWKRVDAEPPRPLRLERSEHAPLPHAPIVILTWTDAEWAALEHVFCSSTRSLSPEQARSGNWQREWIAYKRSYRALEKSLPSHAPSRTLGAWGRYRMATLGPERAPVLLVKSDMHLATDGPGLPLEEFIRRIALEARPELLLTIGTAGGARLDQCIGTIVVSNAFQLDLDGELAGRPGRGDLFGSGYRPDLALLERVRGRLFRRIPVQRGELRRLASAVGCSLDQVMNPTIEPGRLTKRCQPWLVGDPAAPTSLIRPVLTSNGYRLGTTDENYGPYSCLEMDDALVARAASRHALRVGSVRNVSDPVVNAKLDPKTQESWSYSMYATYGLYTSENGALAAWALVKGGREEMVA